MAGFTLHLQSATQYERVEGVTSFVAADASGAFGILERHERMMTVVGFCLARFRSEAAPWRYLALPGGLVYFVDGALYVSTRRFVASEDYATAAEAVERTLRGEERALEVLKRSVTRLEREMLRRLWRLQEAA